MPDSLPLFGFRFCPIEDSTIFGEQQRHVWFWLTDGWYWINVGDQQFFRLADKWLAGDPSGGATANDLPPYPEYFVVRLWEDVLQLFPEVLEPIPPDLWERVSTPDRATAWMRAAHSWLESQNDDPGDHGAFDAWYTALGWYDTRKLSNVPFTPPPSIWFVRHEDTIHVRWDNRAALENGIPVWAASVGEITLSMDDFMTEVETFDARLIAGMRERIDAAVAYWSQPDRPIDPTDVLRDHAGRQRQLRDRLAIPLSPTDWDDVRGALSTLGL